VKEFNHLEELLSCHFGNKVEHNSLHKLAEMTSSGLDWRGLKRLKSKKPASSSKLSIVGAVGQPEWQATEVEAPKEDQQKAKVLRRNKRTKTTLEFDPQARKAFLTGFRKRKEERRKKAREKAEKEAKEEVRMGVKNSLKITFFCKVRRARETARARLSAAKSNEGYTSSSHRVLPEVEHLLKADTEPQETDFGTCEASVVQLDLATDAEKARRRENEGEDEEEVRVHFLHKGVVLNRRLLQVKKTTATLTKKADSKAVNRMAQKNLAKSAKARKAKRVLASSSSSGGSSSGKGRARNQNRQRKGKRDRHHHPMKAKKK